jgi:predicted amidohydrolase
MIRWMLSLIESAVAGSAPFLPVRLVVFPEFARAVPVCQDVRELDPAVKML